MGGMLFVAFLLLKWLPQALQNVLQQSGQAMMRNGNNHDTAQALVAVGGLMGLVGMVLGFIYKHEEIKFEWNNAEIEGRPVQYSGTLGDFVGAMIVPVIITFCTIGIYYPWAKCAYWKYICDRTTVGGERLEFRGQGGDFFPIALLNGILMVCTCYIYSPWAWNAVWEWQWQNTSVNGRPFMFNKDGGAFFGTWFLNIIISLCTGFIYWPWALAEYRKWELSRVA
jgi:uncharacterized membrane protein YjgN (DUF898 family)